jgi:hypothetical protein
MSAAFPGGIGFGFLWRKDGEIKPQPQVEK